MNRSDRMLQKHPHLRGCGTDLRVRLTHSAEAACREIATATQGSMPDALLALVDFAIRQGGVALLAYGEAAARTSLLGATVEAIRTRYDCDVDTLAQVLGVSVDDVGALEAGREVTADTVAAVAEWLQIARDEAAWAHQQPWLRGATSTLDVLPRGIVAGVITPARWPWVDIARCMDTLSPRPPYAVLTGSLGVLTTATPFDHIAQARLFARPRPGSFIVGRE